MKMNMKKKMNKKNAINVTSICNALPPILKPTVLSANRFQIHVEGECVCEDNTIVLHDTFKHYALDITFSLEYSSFQDRCFLECFCRSGTHPHVCPDDRDICLGDEIEDLSLVSSEADCVHYVLLVVAALSHVSTLDAYYSLNELIYGIDEEDW